MGHYLTAAHMINPLKTNLHTHTYRCKHAEGDVDAYCQAALDAGLETLGMSDHTALPDDRWLGVRMSYAELPAYMDAITQAQAQFPQLNVLRAAECEFDSVYLDYYRDELLGRYACDYLIGAVHFFPHKGEWKSPFVDFDDSTYMGSFVDYFIASMECGLFAFMAHPDNFGSCLAEFDKEAEACTHAICQAAEDLGVIWEVNGYGYRKGSVETAAGARPPYPLENFWDIVSDYRIKVIANSDAHRPQDVAANIDDALDLVRRKGLELASLDEVLQRV